MINFIKERKKVLLSLDKNKIKAFARKYNVKLPENLQVFWVVIHKARLQISIPEAEKQISRDWLTKNGFSQDIK